MLITFILQKRKVKVKIMQLEMEETLKKYMSH